MLSVTQILTVNHSDGRDGQLRVNVRCGLQGVQK